MHFLNPFNGNQFEITPSEFDFVKDRLGNNQRLFQEGKISENERDFNIAAIWNSCKNGNLLCKHLCKYFAKLHPNDDRFSDD